MPANCFVDTNLLVYARDSSEPLKQQQAFKWMAHLWSSRTGRLSFQVLQEFYITVTEKLRPGMDIKAAQQDIRTFMVWKPLPVDIDVLESAWTIQERYQISWWDALIVSAAQLADCQYLLTEDLQNGQKFGKVQTVNPFLTLPAALNP
jgi:predicted nucleic acid-binding protein